jgi:peptidoglycan L-alanyl-D-glutamate endopeptidase CwlK
VSALLLSRIDTELLFPPFLVRLQSLLDEAMARGRAYWVIEGHRSFQRSDDLYAQGRSKPGPIVTNARAGQSAHNFGIAGDLVLDGYLDRAGLQPDYRPASYDLLGELCPKHGLVWGGSWQFKDRPHIQMPDFVTAADMAPLRAELEKGGLQAVFTFLYGHYGLPIPLPA